MLQTTRQLRVAITATIKIQTAAFDRNQLGVRARHTRCAAGHTHAQEHEDVGPHARVGDNLEQAADELMRSAPTRRGGAESARWFTEGDVLSLDGHSGNVYAGQLDVVTERPTERLEEVA
jgi:hypothetical protein